MKFDFDRFKLPESQGSFSHLPDAGNLYMLYSKRVEYFQIQISKIKEENQYSSGPPRGKNFDDLLSKALLEPEESIHIIVKDGLNRGWSWTHLRLLWLMFDHLGIESPVSSDHAGYFVWQVIDFLTWYEKSLDSPHHLMGSRQEA